MVEDTTGSHHTLWATSVFEVFNPEHEQLKSALVEVCRGLETASAAPIESKIAPNIKQGLYESRLDFLSLDQPAVVSLREFVLAGVQGAIAHLNPKGHDSVKFEVSESWAHVTHAGGYHDHHSHPGRIWCGIYYVDAGECDFDSRSGVNRFYAPVSGFFDQGTGEGSDSVDLVPADGKLILFPGYLFHSALPYFGGKDRVVVAFNTCLL